MSKPTDERETPLELFKPVDDLFHFTLDVCATAENAKCEKFYTIEDNGLTSPWAGNVCWCNPPYSRGQVQLWLLRTRWQWDKSIVVVLTQADTSTKWFQTIWEHAQGVFFPDRRYSFGHDAGAKFANCLSFWGPRHKLPNIFALEQTLGGKAIWL